MYSLLISSGGGHLKQLDTLARRMAIEEHEQCWVTFNTGLSRNLLTGRRVVYAPYAAPRDTRNILRNTALAARLLWRERFSSAVSTGSSLAVSFLPLAARRGIPSHFVETAARAAGPSLTGRILGKDGKVHVYTQYPSWADNRWLYRGSIFDDFEPGPARSVDQVKRVVVSLGTTESYGFGRLVSALVPLLDGCEVLWQVGSTDTSSLGIDSRAVVPHTELVDAIRAADVVISHAGTGAALTALELGRCPVLVPRRSYFGEHIDDHQIQVADVLAGRGLAVASEVGVLDAAAIHRAARMSAQRAVNPPEFRLVGAGVAARTLAGAS